MSSGRATGEAATPLEQLRQMDDEAFEYFVGDLWERQGWSTKVSQKSRDKSLDVMAEKERPYHQRHAIQAKRYKQGNNVGGPSVAEYYSLIEHFDADAAVVVTTSGFTTDARERAETLGVKLINGEDLVAIVDQYDAYDLLEQYTSGSVGSMSNDDFGGGHSDRWWRVFLAASVLGVLGPLVFGAIAVVGPRSIGIPAGGIAVLLLAVGYPVAAIGVHKDTSEFAGTRSNWDPSPVLYTVVFLLVEIIFQLWYLTCLGYAVVRWYST